MSGNGGSEDDDPSGFSAGFVSEWVDSENHDDEFLSRVDQFASPSGFNVTGYLSWVSDRVDEAEEMALEELPEVTTRAEDQED